MAIREIGFISAWIDGLAYKSTFDLEQKSGTVILNVSSFHSSELENTTRIARKVVTAGLGMGCFTVVAKGSAKLAGYTLPRGDIAIGTVCSVMLNSVFYSYGIPTISKFGGLLELRDWKPLRFTQIIHYDGTTIDPIEVFIKGGMTRVKEAARTGTGIIGTSFREIPAAALAQAGNIIRKLEHLGMNGVLMMGVPGKPVLDIPVLPDRVGIVVAAGLNPIAAVEEAGICTENHAMATLYAFDKLRSISDDMDICKGAS